MTEAQMKADMEALSLFFLFCSLFFSLFFSFYFIFYFIFFGKKKWEPHLECGAPEGQGFTRQPESPHAHI